MTDETPQPDAAKPAPDTAPTPNPDARDVVPGDAATATPSGTNKAFWAGVGIGSAGLVAALMYTKRAKKRR